MVDLSKIDLSLASNATEKAAIRYIRINDTEERRRLWEIENDPLVKQFVEELADNEEDLLIMSEIECDYLPVAVAGKAGHVETEEIDKLQGWICVAADEQERVKRIKKLGVYDFKNLEYRILEISFAKHSKSKPKQISSAVRQVLNLLFAEHTKAGIKLLVTAYTNAENEASKRLLQAVGFVEKGRIKYHSTDKTEDHFFVFENAK